MGSLFVTSLRKPKAVSICALQKGVNQALNREGQLCAFVCVDLYVTCLTTSDPLWFKLGFTCFHLLCLPRKYWQLTLHFHLSLPLWEADLISTPWTSEQTSEEQRGETGTTIPLSQPACSLEQCGAAPYTVTHTRRMKGSLICSAFFHCPLYRPHLEPC